MRGSCAPNLWPFLFVYSSVIPLWWDLLMGPTLSFPVPTTPWGLLGLYSHHFLVVIRWTVQSNLWRDVVMAMEGEAATEENCWNSWFLWWVAWPLSVSNWMWSDFDAFASFSLPQGPFTRSPSPSPPNITGEIGKGWHGRTFVFLPSTIFDWLIDWHWAIWFMGKGCQCRVSPSFLFFLFFSYLPEISLGIRSMLAHQIISQIYQIRKH